MPPAVYITTSIPYVNADPHVGHALEYVQADVFARYNRLLGRDTRLLTGTDENSLKNVHAAAREGVPVPDLVERYAHAFRMLCATLGVSHDDFIRTSVDRRHHAGAQRFWDACAANGDISKRHYRGLYCVGCEQFYASDELADGRCLEHGTLCETVEEENYFFRLSRYGKVLSDLLDSGRLRIIPETRRREARAFIERGLDDFSISRSRERARGWGIAVPGDPSQIIYVWFDALTNYLTALGYASDDARFSRYWLGDGDRVHVIGKGILRFHAIFWPAMLLSARLPLPTLLVVHGYLTVDGKKISKSLGNAINPLDVCEWYGAEAVRYWLLREVPATGDADYTDQRVLRRYQSDLANGLGNLVHRTVSMLHRYNDGVLPDPTEPGPLETALQDQAVRAVLGMHTALAAYDPAAALASIWGLVAAANRYVVDTAPWILAERGRADDSHATRLDSVLYHLSEAVRLIGEALRPFLPATAERIARQIGAPPQPAHWSRRLAWGRLPTATRVGRPEPLFPRLSS